MKTLVTVFENAMPDSGPEDANEKFGAFKTYGLQKGNPEFWKILINIVLPLILKWLGIDIPINL